MDKELKTILAAMRSKKELQALKIEGQEVCVRVVPKDESKPPTIELRIVLNKYSRWYGTEQYKYREKINLNAFDETLNEVKQGKYVMKSYIDHDRSIRGLITSTNREGVKLYKQNNEIVMSYPVEEGNELAKRVYEQISNGEIESNSFIMYIDETKVEEIDKDGAKEVNVEITKARLVSIDPVYEGFYDFNIMDARNVESHTPHVRKDEQKQGDIIMLEIIKKKLIERNIVSVEEATNLTETELFDKYEASERANFDEKLKEIKEEKEKEALRAKFEANIKEIKKDFDDNTELRAKIASLEAAVAKKTATKKDLVALRKTLFNGVYVDSSKNQIKEDIKKEISSLRAMEDARLSESEKAMFRDITGADADSGSQIIPILTDSALISENAYVIPELENARSIPFAGENSTKVPINIAPTAKPTRKNIDDPSTEVLTNTVTAELKPQFYSEHFNWNPRMQTHLNTVAVDTQNVINGHIEGWRTEFATSLIHHVGVTFASLKGSDKNLSTYLAGATSEAVVESKNVGALALSDFTTVESQLVAKYGKKLINHYFRYYMNSESWGAVCELARAQTNDKTITIDIPNMKINSVAVILNDDFADGIAAGKHPIVLFDSRDVRVYGGNTVLRDSKEAEFKKRKFTRQVNTYGEVKLFDPHYRTRVIKIKAS